MARWRVGALGGGSLVVVSGLIVPDLPPALRLAMAVFGALIALAGWRGRDFPRVYNAIAVGVLNVILTLVALEAGASGFLALSPSYPSLAERAALVRGDKLGLQYYATEGAAWAAGYWDEHLRAADRWAYHPYAIWRARPYDGEFINIDARGLRVTPGASCDETPYRIFMFGGSTVWGFGVPDWATLPAYIQAGLADRNACVVNYGQVGFNSTQELIELIQLLQAGDVPDMVIFYDGNNDVSSAHRTGIPGGHFWMENIAPLVRGQPLRPGPDDPQPFTLSAALLRLVAQTSAFRLVWKSVDSAEPDWVLPPYSPEFVEQTASIYLANRQIAQTLAQAYGFEFFTFVQPVLSLVERPYSDEEQMFLWDMPSGLGELYRRVYPYWEAAAETDDHLVYDANVLDEQPYLIWIDYDHLTPWGNLAMAQEILNVILPTVDEALASQP